MRGLGRGFALGIFATALASLASAAPQTIPARPEGLRFAPLPSRVPEVEDHRHLLSSGRPLYVIEDPSLPLFTLRISVPAATFRDPADRPGCLELVSRVLRGGSRESRQGFSRLAVRRTVAHGLTRSVVSLEGLSSAFEPALDLLFDELTAPPWAEEDIERQKRRWLAHRERQRTQAEEALDAVWDRLLYGAEHWTNQPPSRRQILALTAADLAACHRRWWSPRDWSFAVSGDVDGDSLIARLERLLTAAEPASGEAARLEPRPAPPRPPSDAGTQRTGAFLVPFETPRVWLAIGLQGPHRDGDWESAELHAWQAAVELLAGENFTSRLGSKLRGELGSIYGLEVDAGIGTFWPGSFRIRFATSPQLAPQVLRTTLDEMAALAERPAALEELRPALAKIAVLPFQTPASTVRTWLEDDFVGRPHRTWESHRRRIASLRGGDLEAAARRFLKRDRLTIVLVGSPTELDIDAIEKALGGEAVVVLQPPSSEPPASATR